MSKGEKQLVDSHVTKTLLTCISFSKQFRIFSVTSKSPLSAALKTCPHSNDNNLLFIKGHNLLLQEGFFHILKSETNVLFHVII